MINSMLEPLDNLELTAMFRLKASDFPVNFLGNCLGIVLKGINSSFQNF